MANNITVKWIEVKNRSLGGNGVGLTGANYTDLYNSSTGRSTLDFGAVQAGKVTNIKAIVARFSDATTVSDLQFWLDSTNANATGSSNPDLSGEGWGFFYCIVPPDRLNFNISDPNTVFSESQKKGESSLGAGYSMSPVPKTVEGVSPIQFTSNGQDPLSLTIPYNEYADSYLIFLDVQTSSNANSGNTEGWYYRMNFLYS